MLYRTTTENSKIMTQNEPDYRATNEPSELPKKCENTRAKMLAVSDQHKAALFFYPRCKKWDCPACAEMNAKKWSIFARKTTAYISDHLYFVTITARPRDRDLSKSMIAFTESWKRVLARIAYYNSLMEWFGYHQNPKKFIYLAIPEQHKTGKMHMHLICNQWLFFRLSKLIPERRKKKLVILRWKDLAMESGLGYQAKVEPVDTSRVIGYVTKYLSKDMGKNQWPTGFRRIRLSQSWPRLENDPIGDWRFIPLDPDSINSHIEKLLIEQGYRVGYADHLESWRIIDEYERLFKD